MAAKKMAKVFLCIPVIKHFRFSISSRPALGPTQPPIQWVQGALSPAINRQVRQADHSPPSSAEVTKLWIYIHSPTNLHGVALS
jgi:hypothetical protein